MKFDDIHLVECGSQLAVLVRYSEDIHHGGDSPVSSSTAGPTGMLTRTQTHTLTLERLQRDYRELSKFEATHEQYTRFRMLTIER